jgi:universal stress protein A
MRKILIPVDFSSCSRAAMAWGLDLARTVGASVDVLYAWQPPEYLWPEPIVTFPGQPGHSLEEFARSRAGAQLAALRAEWPGESFGERVEVGAPAEVIRRVAADGHYDLIVLGTHGRTGLAHALIGSVAERVVRHAPCAVLTIRSP